MRKIVHLVWKLLICLTFTIAMESFMPSNGKELWEKYNRGEWHKTFLKNFKKNVNERPPHIQNIIIQYLFFDLFSGKINTFFPKFTITLVEEFRVAFPDTDIFRVAKQYYYKIVPYLLFLDTSLLTKHFYNNCPNLQEIRRQLLKYSLPLGDVFTRSNSPNDTLRGAISWNFSSANLYIHDFTCTRYTEHTLAYLPLYTKFIYLNYDRFGASYPETGEEPYDLIFMKNYNLLQVRYSVNTKGILAVQYEVNLDRLPSATKSINKKIQFNFNVPGNMKKHGIFGTNSMTINGKGVKAPAAKNGDLQEIIVDRPLDNYKMIFGFYRPHEY